MCKVENGGEEPSVNFGPVHTTHTHTRTCAHIMCLERVFRVADILVDCLLEVALLLCWESLGV